MTTPLEVPADDGAAAPSWIDDSPVAFAFAGPAGDVTDVNEAWCELTGLGVDASHGDGWWQLIAPADRPLLRTALERAVAARVTSGCDHELVTTAGRRWTRWWISPRSRGTGVTMVVVDLTADRIRQIELEHRATRDPLTGLVNRRELAAFVEHALRRLDRHEGRVVLLFVDLDGFKSVNDAVGHLWGDRVLVAAAHRLADAVRPTDVVARVGGDEFAVLCEDVDDADPVAMVERIRSAFDRSLDVDGTPWSIGASVGAAVADHADRSPDDLLAAADRAMYASKTSCPVVGPVELVAPVGPVDPGTTDEGVGGDVERARELVDRLVTELFGLGLELRPDREPRVDEAVSLDAALDEVVRLGGELQVALRAFRTSGGS